MRRMMRTARWVWSSVAQLADGRDFEAEIHGKQMRIWYHRGGNQGKRVSDTYTVLDIQPMAEPPVRR
jgi:hypothetical protein